MITVKRLGIFCALGLLLAFLMLVGYQSKKIKQIMLRLLTTQHKLEVQALEAKRLTLKTKVEDLNAKRLQKIDTLHAYIRLLGQSDSGKRDGK
jgi:hypothetical protein